MDRERESLWLRTAPGPQYPALAGDLEVDVVVVGAGITGVTAALRLKEAGRRVALVEARRVAGGVTGRTTAHFTAALDARYQSIARRFGREGARLAAASQQAAIDHVQARVEGLGLSCGFRRLPAFLFAEPGGDTADVVKEVKAARRAGLSVTETRHVPLPFPVAVAARFEAQATLHPREYVLGLCARVPGDGSHVFEGTRAVEVHDGEPCRVVTAQGTLRARDVFLATHAPLNKLFLQTKLAHYRSYVVTLALEQPLYDALFFDNDDPYHYLRRHDADGRSYAVVGGEDHKTGTERDTGARFDALERWCADRFRYASVDDRWSAQVVESVDHLPFVGRNSASRHVHVATGFSGNGMTNGTMAALLVSDLVLGRANPWAALYDATRVKPLAAAKDFVRENLSYPLHVVGDRLRGADAGSVDEVAPGEGRIVRVGGEKLAVYRREDGSLAALSPVCTHMYCHVGWNAAERTWDCPCHGSRFTPEGEVVDGPAVRALEPRPLPGREDRPPRREDRPLPRAPVVPRPPGAGPDRPGAP